MCQSTKSRKFFKHLVQMQLLSKALKLAGCQISLIRGYLSDSAAMPYTYTTNATGFKWAEAIFPYQLCAAIFNQRHKRYLILHSSDIFEGYTISVDLSRLLAKVEDKDGPGPVRVSGGRLGKLDAAGEAGMFHKVNKSKLEQLKKTLKDKPLEKTGTADPAKSEE